MTPQRQKLEELRRGRAPTVLDLFSGCGGFSLGLERAGCHILGGVEKDAQAARAHAINFHADLQTSAPELFERIARARDITAEAPEEVVGELSERRPDLAVDILVGGPPCPAFSRVGRAKLREVLEHPDGHLGDPRARLYQAWLRYVEALAPVAVVMENVPEFLNYGGHNLGEETAEILVSLGYRVTYTVLNAVHYGVPQMRERYFLLGVHESAGVEPTMPPATHRHELPYGYGVARAGALKFIRLAKYYQPAPAPADDAPPAVTIADALGGLAPITWHLDGDARPSTDLSRSRPAPLVAHGWAREHMEAWPGRERGGALTAHVTRDLKRRDHRIFRRLEEYEQYPRAVEIGCELLERWLNLMQMNGTRPTELTTSGREMAEVLRELDHALVEGRPADLGALVDAHRGWRQQRRRVDTQMSQLRRFALDLDPPELSLTPSLLPAIREAEALRRASPARIESVLLRLRHQLRRHRRKKEALAVVFGALERQRHVPDLELQPLAAARELDHRLVEIVEATRKTAEMRADASRLALVRVSQELGEFQTLVSDFVPPYDPRKFPNKWARLIAAEPARTLTAHLGKDGYSHIHHDPKQARVLSVREAARLQSFPDSFLFHGGLNAGYRQVGNAVPPLLAWAFGKSILKQLGLRNAERQTDRLEVAAAKLPELTEQL